MPALAAMRTLTVDVPARLLLRGEGDAIVHSAHWPAAVGASGSAPVQIAIHGLGGSHLNWGLLAPELVELGEVWAPDLAGFGMTPPDGRTSSVGDNVDLVIGLIQTISPDRPAVLLGNSMGGHIAYSVAARRPDLVAGIVLIGPALPPLLKRPDPRVALRFLLFTTPFLGEAFLRSRGRNLTPAEQVRETMELCAVDADALDRDLMLAHVDMAAQRRRMPHANDAFLTASRSLMRRLGTGRSKLWSAVDAIAAPGLILQGGQDRLAERVAADRLGERRPDWDYVVYDDLGHVVMIEAPHRVAADIRDWRIRRLPAASAAAS
jgi:pimeloyl-ACP methyl ester carboxylesterase